MRLAGWSSRRRCGQCGEDDVTSNGQWKNRIVSSGVAEPDQLLANPANWRIHPRNQQDALTGVLDEVGYVQDVIVNKRTSEDWPIGERGIETLVDGHLRVMLAMRHNEQQIPVKYVDLSPHEEALILATLDPISALAAPDAAKLDTVLREVRIGSEDVQTLLNDLAHDAGLNIEGVDPNDAFGNLPDTDRAPFQQMTFTLHDSQVESIKRALSIGNKLGDFTDSQNLNSNGNALAFVCETFITDHGNG